MSIASTPFSWASETIRAVISSLASSSTSPVPGSTMSAAANAPSIASSVMSMVSMPALRIASTWALVIFLPSATETSAPGIFTPFLARSPTMVSLTAHLTALPARCSRSTP